MTPPPSNSSEPEDLMAALEKSFEPQGTCVIHGDYYSTDHCRKCKGYAIALDESNSVKTPFR